MSFKTTIFLVQNKTDINPCDKREKSGCLSLQDRMKKYVWMRKKALAHWLCVCNEICTYIVEGIVKLDRVCLFALIQLSILRLLPPKLTARILLWNSFYLFHFKLVYPLFSDSFFLLKQVLFCIVTLSSFSLSTLFAFLCIFQHPIHKLMVDLINLAYYQTKVTIKRRIVLQF